MNNAPTADQAACAAMASQALLFATLGLDDAAGQMVDRLNDLYGAEGVLDGMLVWLDTYLGLAGYRCPNPEHDHSSRGIALAFLELGSERVSSADEVPSSIAWAGRLMAARAADDVAQQAALIGAMPADPGEQGRHVFAVLHCAAMGLRAVAVERGGM